MNFGRGSSPDEFGIVPSQTLVIPPRIDRLPPPGGIGNRVDIKPRADAVQVLGGRLRRTTGDDRVPQSEAPIVAYAGRYGPIASIREILAREDLDYRRDNEGRPLEKLFKVNVYHNAYEPMALDSDAEAARLRGQGVAVPTPP